ncbi:hypothetical protein [Streptomyces wuyuanensis]|uniref:hypothetical protein n=1 Tax=Streptomyces wuyuanensis TaxID=1196353 RepID=UPI00379F5674
MDPGDLIAAASASVAVCAAGISGWQAKHAKNQVRAAEAQITVARQQLAQAERVHQEQLAHAERVHREQNEPYVVVDIQPRGTSAVLVVVVENIGSTIARNVQIAVDPPIESGWGDDVSEMLQRALSHAFPMIPPGRRLEFLLDEQERFKNTDLPTAYTFTVRAEGPYGPMEEMQYLVDFGTYAESLIPQRPLRKMEDHLGKIHSELKKLSRAYEHSHAPAIRAEQGRMLQRLRERREQHSQREMSPDEQGPADPSTE